LWGHEIYGKLILCLSIPAFGSFISWITLALCVVPCCTSITNSILRDESKFFDVQPASGETIGLDGKVLKGSYQLEDDNPNSDSHPAIMLVSAYIVERGLILEPFEVDAKTNEIKALPVLIQKLALKGVVFAFDAINTQKKLVN
jgi:hypothetical protein